MDIVKRIYCKNTAKREHSKRETLQKGNKYMKREQIYEKGTKRKWEQKGKGNKIKWEQI